MDMRIDTLTGDHTTTHLVSTSTVNWVIAQGEGGVTLIDGGYPGHAGAVLESLRRVGSAPEEIRAALLTHAHVDHLGGLIRLREEYTFDVYAHPDEVAHAKREYLEQANAVSLAPIAWQPRVMRWLSQIIPLGALSRAGLDDTSPLGDLSALPGSPVAVPTPGHTRGHCAYLVAEGEGLVSGDALISGHAITSQHGPQCLGPIFTHDPERNAESLEALAATDAHLLLPGHGDLWEGSMRTAVNRALSRR
ncbi:MBL fold metallo-hydrolase [Gordonia caeni]|uniref:MBL fold metallo-hydrolase n=2 Tax=Gordonia caeni TaxID=1007097 RepID=A0ABP7NIY2_9ACTN